tara:strand:+ start:170 stop:310 length:141 start_codon:yes stop_codon:yes gene_type:complete
VAKNVEAARRDLLPRPTRVARITPLKGAIKYFIAESTMCVNPESLT